MTSSQPIIRVIELLLCVTLVVMNPSTKVVLAALGAAAVIALPTLGYAAVSHPAPARHQTAVTVTASQTDGGSAVASASAAPTPDVTPDPSAPAPVAAPSTQAAQHSAQRAAAPADDPAPTDSDPVTPPTSSSPTPQVPGVVLHSENGHPILYCDPSDTPNEPTSLTGCHDIDGNPWAFSADGGWHPVEQ